MSHQDVEYYERRAEAEIELATQSRSAEAVQAHYQLATAYLDKIYGDDVPEAAE
ncbi:MAG TPA: hypothetical protein VF582_07310 [Allosphingosinicella sp.]|jgi:hypothetical protein